MSTRDSWMRAETLQAPEAIAHALELNAAPLAHLAALCQARPPCTVFTVARGSSDHAAQHLAWCLMARLGLPTVSLPPSLPTLYGAALGGPGTLVVALSQSGRSPDLLAAFGQLQRRGSLGVALVNDAASPLALAADTLLPLQAGVEHSVAATKSCLVQLALGLAWVAHWQADASLLAALHTLPERMASALAQADGGPLQAALGQASGLYVLGRGPGLALASECALKLKETCGLQAEAFSGAEVQHGPMALVKPGFPLLLLALPGPAQPGLLALAERLRQRDVPVLLAAPAGTPGGQWALRSTGHELTDGLLALGVLYLAIEQLARGRGLNPDHPPHLRKVTLTE